MFEVVKKSLLIEFYERKTGDVTLVTGEELLILEKKYKNLERDIGIIDINNGNSYITGFVKEQFIPYLSQFPFCIEQCLRLCNGKLSTFGHTIYACCGAIYFVFHSCTVEGAKDLFKQCEDILIQGGYTQDVITGRFYYPVDETYVIFNKYIFKNKEELLYNCGQSPSQHSWDLKDGYKGTMGGVMSDILNGFVPNINYPFYHPDTIFGYKNILLIGLTHNVYYRRKYPLQQYFDNHYYDDPYKEVKDIPKIDYEKNPFVITLPDCRIRIGKYNPVKFIHNNPYLTENFYDRTILRTIDDINTFTPLPKLSIDVRTIHPEYKPIIIGIDNHRYFIFTSAMRQINIPLDLVRILLGAWLKEEYLLAKKLLLLN